MEQKTVEQIASTEEDIQWCKGYEKGFAKGVLYAQQSQPMWREIEDYKDYKNVLVRKGKDILEIVEWTGMDLINLGYTHYLSSEDLLKLPVEKK